MKEAIRRHSAASQTAITDASAQSAAFTDTDRTQRHAFTAAAFTDADRTQRHAFTAAAFTDAERTQRHAFTAAAFTDAERTQRHASRRRGRAGSISAVTVPVQRYEEVISVQSSFNHPAIILQSSCNQRAISVHSARNPRAPVQRYVEDGRVVAKDVLQSRGRQ